MAAGKTFRWKYYEVLLAYNWMGFPLCAAISLDVLDGTFAIRMSRIMTFTEIAVIIIVRSCDLTEELFKSWCHSIQFHSNLNKTIGKK
jgi:hypothetical protein